MSKELSFDKPFNMYENILEDSNRGRTAKTNAGEIYG